MSLSPCAKLTTGQVDLSVIIVCHNDREFLLPCLEGVFSSRGNITWEVIVVDGASTDGAAHKVRELYPDVRMIEMEENLGYPRGNNIGMCSARGEYLLFLNPDTLIQSYTLQALIAAAQDHPEAGAIGCKILNPDGTLQPSCWHFETLWQVIVTSFWLYKIPLWKHISDTGPRHQFDYNKEQKPDIVHGSCLMVRSDLMQEVGGFDTRCFAYKEEADLCHRLAKLGYRSHYTPATSIIHYGAQSTSNYKTWFFIQLHKSSIFYFQKHYGKGTAALVGTVMFLATGIRFAAYGLLTLGSFFQSQRLSARCQLFLETLGWYVGLVDHGESPPCRAVFKVPARR